MQVGTRAAGWSLAILIALSACSPLVPVQSMVLRDGAAVVAAPPGYCLDATNSRPKDGFAVMAPCAVFGASVSRNVPPGIVTFQLGEPGSAAVRGNEAEMGALLKSPQGAALLSASGQAASVTVGGVDRARNRVTVGFTDSAPQEIPGTDPRIWRAFTDLGDRLLTVSVRGPAAAPLDEDDALPLLDRALRGVAVAAAAEAA